MRAMLPLTSLLLGLSILACSPQQPQTPPTEQPAQTPAVGRFPETFEAGSKTAYAEADEQLSSGTWHFTDALIGSAPADHKNGMHAARLRGQGRLRMNFDAPATVRSIRISAASYGTDGASTWEVWASQDGGRLFSRLGQPVRTSGAQLVTAIFPVAATRPFRLEIRKTDGGSARLNLDDITLETTAGSAPAAVTPAPAQNRPQADAVVVSRDDNMALGNPSGATGSLDNPTNYLMVKPQYTLSYNALRGTPTWVSWHLNRAWMGSAPRQDDFRPDPALPRQFYQVTPRSYAGGGFDRGHNCPSADRTTDLDDNSATFLMTNMIPQAGNNNQRTWSKLEEYARSLVQRGNEVYIIMGSYGKGGTGTAGFATTLDNGHVTVPARVWKVLVVLPEGADDLTRISNGKARIIAVDTPNDQSVSPDWSRYRVSVDAIENATGLDLLSKVPTVVQERLESQVDKGTVR